MGSGEILSLPWTWEGLREGVDLVRIEVYEDKMERLPQGSLQSLLLSPPQARGCLSPLRQNLITLSCCGALHKLLCSSASGAMGGRGQGR